MSAIAWLFGLGALAVAFPILFHMIRRTPKGQTEFSSLMFLKPSPPTLTRRSRLENIFLLLMRSAAIILIAFAFMRPFFRGADTLAEFEIANRRVAILVDSSASMKRGDLWEQVKQQVEIELGELEKGDDVSLLTFDDTVNSIVDFNQGAEENVDRVGLVRDGLKTIEPTWARSDLGRALVTVADRLDVWRDSMRAKDGATTSKLQIVVVSDLQKGSKTESLQGYQWPDDIYVKFLSVAPKDQTNATVQLLNQAPEEDDPAIRIRVVNSEESDVEQFTVNWYDHSKNKSEDPVSFYVAPGTSRVLKVDPDKAISAREFVVTGDREDFDNSYYVVPTEQQELSIVYLGDDKPDDAENLQFYLQRSLIDSASRKITVDQLKPNVSLLDPTRESPTLVVVTSKMDADREQQVDAFLQAGGTALVVLSNPEMATATAKWTGVTLNERADDQRSRDNYLMLAELDFSSPLLKPFANPRFNDFTRIKFWRHTSVLLDEAESHVLARFDNDDPAIWRRDLESGGTVFAFASGWQPDDSQLALSTKFVPLVNSLVEIGAKVPELEKSLIVGAPIEFPAADSDSVKRNMIKPDGSQEIIETDQTRFVGADQPGIYRLVSTGTTRAVDAENDSTGLRNPDAEKGEPDSTKPETSVAEVDAKEKSAGSEILFAVNVDRAESITTAIPVEQIEMFSVKIGEQETAASELALMKEMRDRDLEDRQKFWKWLIIGAIVLLIGETWLAGRTESRAVAGENSYNTSPGLS